MMPAHSPSVRRSQSGFSLLELVVSMFIAIEILVAAAVAFDVHNRVAQIQMQVTDMQQSLRVAQYDLTRLVRSAGRGGLPLGLDPDADFKPSDPIPALSGLALEVRNNVTGNARFVERITSPDPDANPRAIEGSDILTVRGCIGGTTYQVDPSTFNWDVDDNDVADDAAQLTIPKTSVAGVLQPLGPLVEDICTHESEAIKGRFILTSPTSLQDYAVADITNLDVACGTADPDQVVLTLDLNNSSTLNPIDPADGVRRYPNNMTASLGCYLEEYRYYVREVEGDAVTPLRPRLTRARFEPGTEEAYLGDSQNLTLDLADGIFDLQVALGLDADFKASGYNSGQPGSFTDDADWIGDDDTIYEADPYAGQNMATDDWLYNDPDDLTADPTGLLFTTHECDPAASCGSNNGQPVQLYFVRVTTVGRTSRPDRTYQVPNFDTRVDGDWVEDHDYDVAPALAYKTGDNAKYRRRILQTIVDMRNG